MGAQTKEAGMEGGLGTARSSWGEAGLNNVKTCFSG